MTPRVLIPLATGFEELEAVTMIDVLRRAGCTVVVAAQDGSTEVTGKHHITLRVDAALADVLDQPWTLIALPGGLPGADHLAQSDALRQRLRQQVESGARVAAICAAPQVLAAAGLLAGRQATSYPGVLDRFTDIRYRSAPVVCDGQITTSRGPSTALSFALTLAAQLVGEPQARQLADKMLVEPAAVAATH